MPASPMDSAQGPVRVTVTSGGAVVPETAQLLSVSVRRALNRVPGATLVFADGDLPEQTFPLSDGAVFKPGARLTISAGYGDSEAVIFAGIVVRHGIKITGGNDARLVIECLDEAARMTAQRKSAQHTERSDAAVIQALIQGCGLVADVSGAATVHPCLIQHDCSDWDYMLARAQANGCVVVVNDGTVVVAEPAVSAAPALTVAYGESLIEFESELDACLASNAAQAQGWKLNEGALELSGEQSQVTLKTRGKLDAATQAHAQQLKSGGSRLRGRVHFQGSPLARVGELIELKGVGERFNGNAYISGLRHRIDNGEWTTEAEFGTPAAGFGSDATTPPAAGRMPGITGLHTGVVLRLDGDPLAQHRIQVKAQTAGIDALWARLLQGHASNGFGAFFVPEIGDEVLLGGFQDDPVCPVVLGSLYSQQHAPPRGLDSGNAIKAIVTRSRTELSFNDDDKSITLVTPGGNRVFISDKEKSIVLSDQSDNRVELRPGGITLASPRDIRISAKGAITVDAAGALTLGSRADATLSGLNVRCEAQVGVVAKGAATAELSAAGQTTVKGALVMIN